MSIFFEILAGAAAGISLFCCLKAVENSRRDECDKSFNWLVISGVLIILVPLLAYLAKDLSILYNLPVDKLIFSVILLVISCGIFIIRLRRRDKEWEMKSKAEHEEFMANLEKFNSEMEEVDLVGKCPNCEGIIKVKGSKSLNGKNILVTCNHCKKTSEVKVTLSPENVLNELEKI